MSQFSIALALLLIWLVVALPPAKSDSTAPTARAATLVAEAHREAAR